MTQQNKNIKGIIIGEREIQMTMFTDTFFLQDMNSLEKLNDTLQVFEKFSSQVNYEKSECCWIGSNKTKLEKPIECKWVNLETNYIKILGMYFSYNKGISYKYNFERTAKELLNVLDKWKYRNLTIHGRIEVVGTLAISKIIYVCNMKPPHVKFIDEVNKLCLEFVEKDIKATKSQE